MHLPFARLSGAAGIAAIAVAGMLAQAFQANAQAEWTGVGIASSPVTTAQDLEAPTNLIVESVIGSVVTLRWTPPIVAPTGYIVEGGLLPGSVIGTVATNSSSASHSFTAPAGSFYLRVRAVVSAGLSAPSNEVLVAVNLAAPPSAPIGLLGLSNGSELVLAWQNTFAGGTPSGIMLEVSGDQTISHPLSLTNRFSFSSVPPGTYTFAVREVNDFGEGGTSNAVTLSFPGTCSPPAPPTNFAASGSGAKVYTSWSPPANGAAPTGYVVDVHGSFEGSLQTDGLDISGNAGPGTYSLSVAAKNACGTSTATPTQTVAIARMNGVITVGEEFSDEQLGGTQVYSLTAPSDGTLVVQVHWNAESGMALGIRFGGSGFEDHSFEDSLRAVGRFAVSRGQTYVVTVEQAPYDYGFGRFWVRTAYQ